MSFVLLPYTLQFFSYSFAVFFSFVAHCFPGMVLYGGVVRSLAHFERRHPT